ncbi:hypothetical protein JK320_25420 [Klebsiella pneumoniae]|uniref:hypothetical protein n=1 Tax=Klebsiella pneumoniae TaxID=573 RepID=UPI00191CCB9E|nr:hypothetical protein [Klebsiella pneumoniae]MBL0830560.1 hypothetical protein [Klebsiella pneumoniae]
MANSPVVVIGISFRDRDANVSKITFYTPWTLTIAEVWSLAFNLAAHVAALSNAALFKIELLFRFEGDTTTEPPPTSDVSRKALLLTTNDADQINGLIIPSIRAIFETIGPYAGIRVDIEHPAVVAFGAALEALPFVTIDGRQFGTLAAGGLAL